LAQPNLAPEGISVQGLADLTLAVRGGRTCLVHRRTRPPLVVQRTLYLDEALPDMAFVYLCNPTAGVLQGDFLQIKVRLCPNARAHLTTQAASKIYAMPDGLAHQDTHLYIEDGAWLEYLPEPLIPFQEARFLQQTSITIAPGAVLVYGEILAHGRAARGESLAYARLQNSLDIKRPDGYPIYREAFSIEPGTTSPLGCGVFGRPDLLGSADPPAPAGVAVLGTLLIMTGELAPDILCHRVRDLLSDCLTAIAGVSILPGGGGIGVKILAKDVASARTMLQMAWAEARRSILGVDAPPTRRY